MEQIIITRADNSTWSLLTKSAVTSITKAEQRIALMGENVISMTVETAVALDFNIRDHITVFGSTYTLNSPPKHAKNGNRKHAYELTWESRQYDLLRPFYLDEGVDGVSISPDFSLTGDLHFFLDVLINNANRIFGAGVWVLGDCPTTDYRTLTFSNEKCLAVLQRLCKEDCFKKEFEIIENAGVCTINIKEAIGTTHATTYEYGKGKGLFNLTRETVSEKDIITRLYVFGSNKNLKSDYRGFSQRLKLPANDLSYIEDQDAIDAYGLIEGVKVFEEIFPHRTGTVSALGSAVTEFIDSSMDFDLNEVDESGNTLYLIAGTAAKLTFNTGNLAGYQFGITAYDHSTKKFTLQAFIDERGQPFPDAILSAFQIGVGDKYVITDIIMPQSYIDAAEAEILAAGQAWYDLVCQPRVQYSQSFDELFFKQKYAGQATVNVFGIGDNVPIKDSDIGVDKSIRLKVLKRDVIRPYKYALDLYDYSEEALVTKLISATNDTARIISAGNLDSNTQNQTFINSLRNCLVVMNAGTSGQYLRSKLALSVDKGLRTYSDNGQFPPSIFDAMPYASTTAKGGIKIDGTTIAITDGVISVIGGAVGFDEAGNYSPSGTWAFTSAPTVGGVAVSLAGHTHDDRYFTESETTSAISSAIASLVGSVPATLDTLQELGDALGDDPNFATTVSTALGNRMLTSHAANGITSTNITNWGTAYTHSQAAHQTIINGTGFVKASGTGLSYDNSTYLTTTGTAADSDKLDGNHATYYGSFNYDGNSNGIDWNALNYYTTLITIQAMHQGNYTGQSNYPKTGYGELITFGGSTSFPAQLYFGNSAEGVRYRCAYQAGAPSPYTWAGTTWSQIWTNNDFAITDYSPLASPTFTGTVTIPILKIGDFTFSISGTDLILKNGTTVIAKLSSSGGLLTKAGIATYQAI